MTVNLHGLTGYYSCEICCQEATVFDADAGEFCQRCADRYAPYTSDAFFDALDR